MLTMPSTFGCVNWRRQYLVTSTGKKKRYWCNACMMRKQTKSLTDTHMYTYIYSTCRTPMKMAGNMCMCICSFIFNFPSVRSFDVVALVSLPFASSFLFDRNEHTHTTTYSNIASKYVNAIQYALHLNLVFVICTYGWPHKQYEYVAAHRFLFR